jgi:hypothetical protein
VLSARFTLPGSGGKIETDYGVHYYNSRKRLISNWCIQYSAMLTGWSSGDVTPAFEPR